MKTFKIALPDSDANIYIRSERNLTPPDAMQILLGYYSMNTLFNSQPDIPDIRDTADITVTHVERTYGTNPVTLNDYVDNYMLQIKDDETEHISMYLISAYLPSTVGIKNHIKNVAKVWSYKHNLHTCDWKKFLTEASDAFLHHFGIIKQYDLSKPVKLSVALEPENLVESHVIQITINDKTQPVNTYRVMLPTHIITRGELTEELLTMGQNCKPDVKTIVEALVALEHSNMTFTANGIQVTRTNTVRQFEFDVQESA